MGGDLNMTVNDIEDRKQLRAEVRRKETAGKIPIQTQSYLADFIAPTQWIDVWRHTNPMIREYTHFSHPQQSFARIDYILTTTGLMPKIADTEIHEISISDHAIVSIKLENTKPHAQQHISKYPSSLANNAEFNQFIKKEWEEYSQYNDAHKLNPTLFWEAGKAFMRGRIISNVAAFKREIPKNYAQTSALLRESQLKFQKSGQLKAKQEWFTARLQFNMCQGSVEMLHTDQRDLKLLRYGSNLGKSLSHLTK